MKLSFIRPKIVPVLPLFKQVLLVPKYQFHLLVAP